VPVPCLCAQSSAAPRDNASVEAYLGILVSLSLSLSLSHLAWSAEVRIVSFHGSDDPAPRPISGDKEQDVPYLRTNADPRERIAGDENPSPDCGNGHPQRMIVERTRMPL